MVENIANIWKRILGGVIDTIVLVVFLFVYVRLFGVKLTGSTYHVHGMYTFIMYLVMLLYYVVLEAITGKTIGKYIIKTKVVNQNGEIISWLQSFIRNIMRIIDGFAFYIVALIAMLISRKNQRLGDMLAKTYVIND